VFDWVEQLDREHNDLPKLMSKYVCFKNLRIFPVLLIFLVARHALHKLEELMQHVQCSVELSVCCRLARWMFCLGEAFVQSTEKEVE
jgi:hypothetical protein